MLAAGFDVAELDFEGGFWMDKPFAERLGAAARDADIVLSVHAPIAAFVGHVDAQKTKRAFGMLDHTAGLAALCGAEVVVVHPGFLLLERPRSRRSTRSWRSSASCASDWRRRTGRPVRHRGHGPRP